MTFRLSMTSFLFFVFTLEVFCAAVNEGELNRGNGITQEKLNFKVDVDDHTEREKLHFEVNVNGVTTQENVELNYAKNYVKVTTPGFEPTSPMLLIHDYKEDVTLFVVKGHCFLMNEFNDIPKKMDDWRHLNFNAEAGVVQAGGTKAHRVHKYKITKDKIDRTSLPLVMQEVCDHVDNATFRETLEGEAAYNAIHEQRQGDAAYMGVMFVPNVCRNMETDESEIHKRGYDSYDWYGPNYPWAPWDHDRTGCTLWCFICFPVVEE